jgi:hypothetical protein
MGLMSKGNLGAGMPNSRLWLGTAGYRYDMVCWGLVTEDYKNEVCWSGARQVMVWFGEAIHASGKAFLGMVYEPCPTNLVGAWHGRAW